jgi:hypothetical protein
MVSGVLALLGDITPGRDFSRMVSQWIEGEVS